ncbi:hypothetical protein DOTSEDRAFT_68550 [Dothistroma septosporum NZE10]|uniref:Adenosine deaminase domain-containing protein n=1 Tax=Dothistroma septosporum (strain NZE10 / CBS 128990) TaxID=675120 RepID=N1Q262_DOTSN|nr:hypothetical protein DOTSEDRAFT_68550 [Dothistroma septosporum NZE10]
MHVVDKLKDKFGRRKAGQQVTVAETTAAGVSERLTQLDNMDSTADPTAAFDAAFEAYCRERDDLIAAERALAWNQSARSSATAAEQQAGQIIWKIRENERVDPRLYGNLPGEEVPGPDKRDMGGRFLVNKERIEESKVFKIACRMPKGAHLHLHLNAVLPPEDLMPEARKLTDTFYIRSTKPLVQAEDFIAPNTEIVFEVKSKNTKQADIFDPKYVPNPKDPNAVTWMRWANFRQRFPGTVPLDQIPFEIDRKQNEDLDNAERWAREKIIFTQDRVYNDRQTTNGIWACFNQGTRASKGLVHYESMFRLYIRRVIDTMIEDKVMYFELRPMLLDKFIPKDDGEGKLDHKAQMNIICEEMKNKQEELKRDDKIDAFPFGLKVIYATPRSIGKLMMEGELRDCIALKKAYPDLICGFDLVGAEDRPHNIGYYADLLLKFVVDSKTEFGEPIPFMFHAGESLLDTGGSHNPENSNLYDSLLFNSKRIGHGYALLKHPVLTQRYRERKICLELCPISNELLGLCGNARQHIFPELLAAGLQCTLNADNPNMFRYAGHSRTPLSYEFYQVMVGDPRMDIHGWKQLALWSIEHSCISPQQQARAKTIFMKEWQTFCLSVVEDFGSYASDMKDLNKSWFPQELGR